MKPILLAAVLGALAALPSRAAADDDARDRCDRYAYAHERCERWQGGLGRHEAKRREIEREFARELAKAERKFDRERWDKGDEAWWEFEKSRDELAFKRVKELRALERELYARSDDDDDNEDDDDD